MIHLITSAAISFYATYAGYPECVSSRRVKYHRQNLPCAQCEVQKKRKQFAMHVLLPSSPRATMQKTRTRAVLRLSYEPLHQSENAYARQNPPKTCTDTAETQNPTQKLSTLHIASPSPIKKCAKIPTPSNQPRSASGPPLENVDYSSYHVGSCSDRCTHGQISSPMI